MYIYIYTYMYIHIILCIYEYMYIYRQTRCSPPLSYLVDCWSDETSDDEWADEGGNRCLVALDDMGYRVFNDVTAAAYGAPLVWHCRDHLYCAGLLVVVS
jgi:hypothetical protein